MYDVFLQMDAPVELFAKNVDIGCGVVSVALTICVFIHHLLDVQCLYRYLHDVYVSTTHRWSQQHWWQR